jgi:hypothetical protein
MNTIQKYPPARSGAKTGLKLLLSLPAVVSFFRPVPSGATIQRLPSWMDRDPNVGRPKLIHSDPGEKLG